MRLSTDVRIRRARAGVKRQSRTGGNPWTASSHRGCSRRLWGCWCHRRGQLRTRGGHRHRAGDRRRRTVRFTGPGPRVGDGRIRSAAGACFRSFHLCGREHESGGYRFRGRLGAGGSIFTNQRRRTRLGGRGTRPRAAWSARIRSWSGGRWRPGHRSCSRDPCERATGPRPDGFRDASRFDVSTASATAQPASLTGVAGTGR
jgi:hypothetical protein